MTTTAGHQLHAVEWHPLDSPRRGAEPDVLLVHGLASNARLWGDVAVGLAERGHRVVAYDQRGHGHSDRADDGFAWDGVLGDLADVVAALDLDRPIAIGQSWGGNVVLEAAARLPDVVRSVVGVDGGHIDLQATFDDADAAWEALTPPPLKGESYEDIRDRMTERFADWPPHALSAQLANFTRTPDGRAAPALRRADHETVVRELFHQRPTETARAATVPIMLAPCRRPDDAWSTAVEQVVESAAVGRLHWFEDADHDVHAQRPDDVVQVLRAAIDDGFLDPAIPRPADVR